MKHFIVALMLLAFCAPLRAQTCSNVTHGVLQSGGSLGSDTPRLGDVYAVRWSNAYSYADDDQGSPSTITVCPGSSICAPGAAHSITSGVFQAGPNLTDTPAGANNPFGANLKAGFSWSSGIGSTPTWTPGTWTWSLLYQDRLGNTCSASNQFTVLPSWNPGHGFLRPCATNAVNFCTDGDGKAFWGTGYNWYPLNEYAATGWSLTTAGVPAHMRATLNTTTGDLAWASGVQFIYPAPGGSISAYVVCNTDFYDATTYWGISLNSATDATVNTSQQLVLGNGAVSGTVDCWQGWVRNLGVSGNHADSYQVPLSTAAQILSENGEHLIRFSNNNAEMPSLDIQSGSSGSNGTGWLSSGYNLYKETSPASALSSNSYNAGGLPTLDIWYAAANAAGIHNLLGGFVLHDAANNPADDGNCPSYVCNGPTGASNLQYYWAMLAARYAAFGPIWEFLNEAYGALIPGTAWVNSVATTLNAGVSGIMCAPSCGGSPAPVPTDPYSNLMTLNTSGAANYAVSPGDTNLKELDLDHSASLEASDYTELTNINSIVSSLVGTECVGHIAACSAPRFQGEVIGTNGYGGTIPGSQSRTAPNP